MSNDEVRRRVLSLSSRFGSRTLGESTLLYLVWRGDVHGFADQQRRTQLRGVMRELIEEGLFVRDGAWIFPGSSIYRRLSVLELLSRESEED